MTLDHVATCDCLNKSGTKYYVTGFEKSLHNHGIFFVKIEFVIYFISTTLELKFEADRALGFGDIALVV